MNQMLIEFAQSYLRENIVRLPEGSQRVFKQMYGRNYGKRTLEDAMLMPIFDVINEIPTDSLDWAMQQVKRSLDRNNLR